MGQGEVYDYIKDKTLEQLDSLDNQIKITANQIINDLNENEQTIHRILNKLKNEKDTDIKTGKFKSQIIRKGKQIIYYERYWWIS